ncbi:MAG: hypothetical protein IIZ73_01550 [Ruminococcus sp.]|nr:hypothetical protein [Ruminococcus sp.]
MALFDWNDDGNNDLLDDWIEYQIYKDVTGETDISTQGSHTYGSLASGRQSRAGISGLRKLLIGIILLIVIVSVYNACRPKCAYPDCDNSPEDGSIYCLLHDPDRYKGLVSNTRVTAASDHSTPETTATTAYKTPYRSSTAAETEAETEAETDEYYARDYIDPEDFYEDHYDDFYDYDEAEEYWYEYGDEYE